MHGVVGDIEADTGRKYAQNNGHSQHRPGSELIRQDQTVEKGIANQKEKSFGPHCTISVGRDGLFSEVSVDALAHRSKKRRPVRVYESKFR